MPRTFKVFLNPTAGTAYLKKITPEDVKQSFSAHECVADVHLLEKTDRMENLVAEAKNSGCEAIVSGGGDGTLRPIVKALIGQSIPLGILPLGTYNNTAFSLGIPQELDKAVERICHGKVLTMDIGKSSDGDYFLEAAGAGLDAALFPIGEEMKSGRLRRLGEALRIVFTYRPHRIFLKMVDANGVSFDHATKAIWVIVANGPNYGPNLPIAPGASLFDGLLTVKVVHHFTVPSMFLHFLSVLIPFNPPEPRLSNYMVKSLRIESRSRIPFHVDGEEKGDLPVSFEIVPDAVKIIL